MLTDVNTTPSRSEVRLGAFIFDRKTGDIRPRETGDAAGTRLAPQPAKLLQLLIEKDGDLLSREEIRTEIWPETHIEFDQSLRFCVRQIRAALGDSATKPTYIETLPKRGYRLLQPVQPISSEATPTESATRPPRTHQDSGSLSEHQRDRRVLVSTHGDKGKDAPLDLNSQASSTQRSSGPHSEPQDVHSESSPRTYRVVRYSLAAAALLVMTALAWLATRQPAATPDGTPIRLAIMPFELATEGDTSADLAELSEWLLAELAGRGGEDLEVIGPRSTAVYSSFPFPRMKALENDFSIDYVLNARYFTDSGETRFLVELIRLGDGAHPWVQYYTNTSDWLDVGVSVRDHVAEALALPP